jgi:hypothetical protein
MKNSGYITAAAAGLAFGLLVGASANADPIATFSPTDSAPNVALVGTTLSSSSKVVFDYQGPNLSALGDLDAAFSLSATETGAIAFGPIALATFDGSFALTYAGPDRTASGVTVHTGDTLLSGSFLGSVFNGYGTSASIVDSILAGGLVSFDNNNFVSFSGLGDEGLALSLTGVTPNAAVVAGQLSNFDAVSGGQFDADGYTEITGLGTVPEPSTWALMLAGFFGTGAALRRRGVVRRSGQGRAAGRAVGPLLALGLGLLGAAGAEATTFATYRAPGVAPNISLTGLSLSASAPVIYKYLTPGLSAFGNLSAQFTLSATETGAIAFGPLALATFDGSFAFTYAGPTRTVGGVTVHAGDDLLSGVFLGSVFDGYGSSASLVDSVLAGGLVSFSSNPFLTFSGLGDESMSLGLTSVKPSTSVIGGKLTNFTGVSSGQFGADGVTKTLGPAFLFSGLSPVGVPEPATWALMLGGFALAGSTLRLRRKASAV